MRTKRKARNNAPDEARDEAREDAPEDAHVDSPEDAPVEPLDHNCYVPVDALVSLLYFCAVPSSLYLSCPPSLFILFPSRLFSLFSPFNYRLITSLYDSPWKTVVPFVIALAWLPVVVSVWSSSVVSSAPPRRFTIATKLGRLWSDHRQHAVFQDGVRVHLAGVSLERPLLDRGEDDVEARLLEWSDCPVN